MEILVRVGNSKVNFERDKNLSGLSFFKTKGKAEYFVEPESSEMLIEALEKAYKMNLSTSLLGSGTHVIISDEGIEGLLISMKKMKGITIKGNLITAASGESLDGIINTAIEHNLVGLEELGGIPGTIAAALKVNASANGKNLSDYHFYSDYMTKDGKIHRRPDYIDLFGHQTSPISDDEIVLSVTLRLEPSKRTAEARLKKEKFVELMFIPPTANFIGQVFKDPEGMSAKDIIKTCHLDKDFGYNAEFSSFQSNCIFASMNASSNDVISLISDVRDEVEKLTGIRLRLSVSLLGKFHAKLEY